MERFERLRAAREAAGYETASAAAEAIGVRSATYLHHENGTRDFSRPGVAERYARFYRVDLEWLLTGSGRMRRTPETARAAVRIPLDGVVGAGAAVEMIDDPAGATEVDTVDLPTDGTIGALRVRGTSQWPRFLEGETVLYDRRPALPQTLIGHMAIVQTVDGRRLLKTIRRGPTEGVWRLESHNAPPEDARLIGAWRFVGLISA